MLLTYQFELKVNEVTSIILGHLCYVASKLFNIGNYERKEYQSLGFDKMPDWYDQKKRLKDNIWYKSMPSQTSQDVLARLEESWKSYFVLHNKWKQKQNSGSLKKNEGEPKPPYYKKDGYHTNIKYLSNGFKIIDDKIRLSIPKALKSHLKDKYQINDEYLYIKIKRSFEIIKQIEFSYVSNNRYKVFIVYEKDIKPQKKDNKHYISIDIGTKNLLTVYDNKGKSFIVSGKSLLNTNYYFSKKIAYYQSIFDKCFPNHKKGETTKRIKRLYELKNKRIKLIIHRATRYIVDYCVFNDISKVIIGDLSGLLGKEKTFTNNKEKHRYNQNIRTICFAKIYEQLSYKLTQNGIESIIINESYSSGCSPKSNDVSSHCYDIKQRKRRGLFKDGDDIYNSDSVGAYNIMRIYRQDNSLDFDIPLKGLSNPKKEYIPVTDQFLNEDYINWNGKAGNVGISGRNYPTGCELIETLIQYTTQMLGNSIAE
ncbi:MAG: transposase [Bacilli bacterium]|nr:transposase [Bacilli bacterium]